MAKLSHPLFDASVPVFVRYLGQLKGIVDIAGRHCEEQAIDPQTVLQARLAPDMLPFAVQVEIAVNFVFRACAPLAGRTLEPFGEHRNSFATLQARIAQAQTFLATLQPDDMQGSEDREFTDPAGMALVTLGGAPFLLQVNQLNQIWERSDSLLDYAWKSSESEKDRKAQLALAALQGEMAADAATTEALGLLAGTFVGSDFFSSSMGKIFS